MKLTRLIAVMCVVVFAAGCSVNRFAPAVAMPSKRLPENQLITRVAVGSCFATAGNPDIFTRIEQQNPDAFLFIGDNVYAQDESWDPELKSLRQAYADLASVETFTSLRQSVPTMVVWDDHDFGQDDAGADWPGRQTSEKLFEYVWAVPVSDERRQHEGVYYAKTIGPERRRVQMILLDNRYFRTALTSNPDYTPTSRYAPSEDPAQSVLGEAQWVWLEAQLRQPADLRIIATPIQLIAAGHNWESWRMFPKEQSRFYRLLASTKANGVVIVSGDRHAAYMYRLEGQTPYPLYELSTSSLNIPLTTWVKNPVDEPGPHRLFRPYYDSNYGLIDIDWVKGTVSLQVLSKTSEVVHEAVVFFSDLTP